MADTAVAYGEGRREKLAVGVCLQPEIPKPDLHQVLRRGGCEVAFWCQSAEEIVEAVPEAGMDLFLLGVRKPDAAALRCLGALLEVAPMTKAVLVCKRSGKGDVRKALDAGARALVPLSEIGTALLPVIDVVLAGQVSVPGSRGIEAGKTILTAREKQILGQVVLGMTNAEIATKLFLAESTVKSHLSSAFAKLGVTSRNEAAALILNPTAGVGPGILTIPSEKLASSR